MAFRASGAHIHSSRCFSAANAPSSWSPQHLRHPSSGSSTTSSSTVGAARSGDGSGAAPRSCSMRLAAALDLSGHVALVTGAGAGIGRACAEILAEAGAAVVVSDLNEPASLAAAAQIVDDGGNAIGVACDVTDEKARQALVDAAIGRFGK